MFTEACRFLNGLPSRQATLGTTADLLTYQKVAKQHQIHKE